MRALGVSKLLKAENRLRKLLSSKQRPVLNEKGSVKRAESKPRRQSQVTQRLFLGKQDSAQSRNR